LIDITTAFQKKYAVQELYIVFKRLVLFSF